MFYYQKCIAWRLCRWFVVIWNNFMAKQIYQINERNGKKTQAKYLWVEKSCWRKINHWMQTVKQIEAKLWLCVSVCLCVPDIVFLNNWIKLQNLFIFQFNINIFVVCMVWQLKSYYYISNCCFVYCNNHLYILSFVYAKEEKKYSELWTWH